MNKKFPIYTGLLNLKKSSTKTRFLFATLKYSRKKVSKADQTLTIKPIYKSSQVQAKSYNFKTQCSAGVQKF